MLVNHSVIFKHNFDSLMNTFSEPCLQSLDNNPGGTVHVHTVCSLPTHESHEISETQPLPCSHAAMNPGLLLWISLHSFGEK